VDTIRPFDNFGAQVRAGIWDDNEP